MEGDKRIADEKVTWSILLEIRASLQKQETESGASSTTQGLIKRLNQTTNPQHVADCLAPGLFQPSPDSNPEDINDKTTTTSNVLCGSDALSLVACLVSVDAPTYLKPISRSVKHEALRLTSSEHPMVVSPQLLAVMVGQLSGADVEASTHATDAMVACGQKLGPAFTDPAIRAIADTWKNLWSPSDGSNKKEKSTVCVRCANVVVEMVLLGEHALTVAKECGALDLLLAMMTYSADPLLQMSVYDLVERLATTKPMIAVRAAWLCSKDVVNPLLAMAGASDVEADADPILGGAALRVLSALCRMGQQQDSLFTLGGQDLLIGFHRALHKFDGTGELDRLAVVDAISSFACASPEALELVINDPLTRDAWLSLNVAQPKLKAVKLNSVAMVIDPEPQTDAQGDIVMDNNSSRHDLCIRLYSFVGSTADQDSTQVVLALCKSPLPVVRLGAYNLLRAVAKLNTGPQVLLSHAGFFEFLVDRESESTKEGREAKFAVVQAVYDSPVKGLLAEDIVRQLERTLKQGPHYLPPQRPELVAE